jgi:2-(1,2-epoxy-1,2-dihydrophenyl)acetyl-CoA isomerase
LIVRYTDRNGPEEETVDDVIRLDRDGGVAVVTLNRPDRLNAIDPAMMAVAPGLFAGLAADDAVRAVVLTGAGRGFCAGGDLRAATSTTEARNRREEADVIADARAPMAIVEVLRTMPKPVIAAINGACAGAGLAWACACDLRFAARSAFFVTAYVDAGLGGDYGITWSLPRIIGAGRATELLLTGARLSAEEAETIGLVSRVVDDDGLVPAALEVAHGFEARPAVALADLKANLVDGATGTFSATIDAETERLVRRFRSPGVGESLASVLDGRRGRP